MKDILKLLALIVVLSVGVVGLYIFATSMEFNSRYKAFQDKDNQPYAEGTYDQAVAIVDKIIHSEHFEWLGNMHGGNGRDNFSIFDIEYKGVSMRLSKEDYKKYLSFLKTLDAFNETALEVSNPPWK